MAKPRQRSIFISYRRADSLPYALALKAEIESRLESVQVFVDLKRLRIGENWRSSVLDSIAEADAILVLIGNEWLLADEKSGRARLHNPKDAVRQEISAAFAKAPPHRILPILVGGATMPGEDELPDDLRELADINAASLRAKYWNQGVEEIVAALADSLSLKRRLGDLSFPEGKGSKSGAGVLPQQQVIDRLAQPQLAGWALVTTRAPDGREEEWLVTTLTFPTFIDVMQFMTKVAEHCDKLDHHPRWENQYRDIKISLSTWDVGLRVTEFDMMLAGQINVAARHFGGQVRQ